MFSKEQEARFDIDMIKKLSSTPSSRTPPSARARSITGQREKWGVVTTDAGTEVAQIEKASKSQGSNEASFSWRKKFKSSQVSTLCIILSRKADGDVC